MWRSCASTLALLFLANYARTASSAPGAETPRRLRGGSAPLPRDNSAASRELGEDVLRAKMQIIDEAFADVTDHGDYFSPVTPGEYINDTFANVTGHGNPMTVDAKRDVTWKMCTEINWTRVGHLPADEKMSVPAIEAMVRALHMGACMEDKRRDPTCAALRAALKATVHMKSLFPDGPVFANYSVVSWGTHPSWSNGSVTSLNYDVMPPTATLQDPTGVIGYGLCDIIRTILTQSANQMQTGTCSYVAFLAVLSHKAPALTIKLAMRLFWTGRISLNVGSACSPIYKQQPGLIPFLNHNSWQPSFYGGSKASACSGNELDCAKSGGTPTQNAGLTSMWSQHLMSAYARQNWGFCDERKARAGMMWPGQSKAEAAQASAYQGGTFSSMMWMCNSVIDPLGKSCKFHFNTNVCLGVDDDKCKTLVALMPDAELYTDVLLPAVRRHLGEAFMFGYISEHDQLEYAVGKLEPTFQRYPMLQRYSAYVRQVAVFSNSTYVDILNLDGPVFPSFTSQMLEETCQSHNNVLIIDATVLSFVMQIPEEAARLKNRRLPFFGNFVNHEGTVYEKSKGCNHAVYLQTCDVENNNYVVWTWGATVNLSKEIILGWPVDQPSGQDTRPAGYTWNSGSVCGSITADQITIA